MGEWTTAVLVANGIALINGVLFAIAGQQKKQVRVLFIQAIASVLFATQYWLLGAMTGVVMATLGAVRMVIFYRYKRADKLVPLWVLMAFLVVAVSAGIWSWNEWMDVLPIIAIVLISWGQWQPSMAKLRWVMIVMEVLWFVFNRHNRAYVNMGLGVVMVSSVVIAMVRERKGRKHARS